VNVRLVPTPLPGLLNVSNWGGNPPSVSLTYWRRLSPSPSKNPAFRTRRGCGHLPAPKRSLRS
jgi:hypothetical protein